LLIQDDASSDSTEAVCRNYERLDQRVKYQRNPLTLGMPGNLNAAISRARSELIANLHDGDVFRSDLLEVWRDALLRHEAGFVFNDLEVLDSNFKHVRFARHSFPPVLERNELVDYMLERFDSPVWGTVMARAHAYRSRGLFDPRFSFIADVEMWMRLNLVYRVAYVQEALIGLTPHEDDRPYAYVNWDLERAHVAMRLEIAEQRFSGQPERMREYRRRLREMQERRWAFNLGSCVKRCRFDLVEEGTAAFRAADSRLLRALGWAGRPVGALALFQKKWGANVRRGPAGK
jgi:glycosyltransferase involved in cell wall biosynthesis